MFFIKRILNQRRVSEMLVGFKKNSLAFPLYNFNRVCSPIRVVGPGVVLSSQVSVRFMFPNVLLNL